MDEKNFQTSKEYNKILTFKSDNCFSKIIIMQAKIKVYGKFY